MDTSMLIEIFGYIGSFLVLVSFLMVSVVKLRVVNSIGSTIFMIYALIIKSYPTAVMNFCLVLINLHFLWKMSKSEKEYDLVQVDKDDSFLKYQLEKYQDNIKSIFPNVNLSFEKMNKGYLVCCKGQPVGITLGNEQNGEIELLLDYSIPEYRDFSIGKFLFMKLKEAGLKKAICNETASQHIEYLKKMGFQEVNKQYIKEL